MTTKTSVTIRGLTSVCTYTEGIVRLSERAGLPYTISRESHIEPICRPRWFEWLFPWNWNSRDLSALRLRKAFARGHGSAKYFGIFWEEPIKLTRVVDFCDDERNLFSTYEAARDYEVTIIERLRVRGIADCAPRR